MVKWRAITFSAPMIAALQVGAKTQTRRLVNARHPDRNPFGDPGDGLWVRESHRLLAAYDALSPAKAFEQDPAMPVHLEANGAPGPGWGRLRQPRFMLRAISRLSLEVASVRRERLHEISEGDALAEGMGTKAAQDFAGLPLSTARTVFARSWDLLHQDVPWCENPLVWVVCFGLR